MPRRRTAGRCSPKHERTSSSEHTSRCCKSRGLRGVAVAKRELTVWGKLAPAEHSLAHGALPIGLASHVELQRDIAAGMIVCSADGAMPDSEAVAARRNMEQRFAARAPAIAAQ